ncbi:hypothetical protein ETU08_07865 [Apibacter muscae]|uniref:hypothetical protein n=1 Tax=Apibacter muscae TaxID=2509004 RepID=UPI0011AC0FA5|nr:hypothetical protein [Apibacter muscae]TWP29193.1 hypothetical protein ETU08_07865 [Apibacter muscae]
MKNIFLLSIVLLITGITISCSSDDDIPKGLSANQFPQYQATLIASKNEPINTNGELKYDVYYTCMVVNTTDQPVDAFLVVDFYINNNQFSYSNKVYHFPAKDTLLIEGVAEDVPAMYAESGIKRIRLDPKALAENPFK